MRQNCVPDLKIKYIVRVNLPATVHCIFLLGLIQWDLAPDALRILCLGLYLWCLHVSQLAL